MKIERISEVSFLMIIGALILCYKQSINKLISSNCIKLRTPCCELERQPLTNDQAIELAEFQGSSGLPSGNP